MPKVCFVSCSLRMRGLLHRVPDTPTGGAEFQQVIMARALAAAGTPVEFLLLSEDGFDAEVTDDGIPVNLGIRSPVGNRFLRTAKALFSVLHSVRRVRADVYYVRGACAEAGYTGLASRLCRKVFVFGVAHNRDLDGGHASGMNALNRWLYNAAIRGASAVFVQTEEQMRLLHSRYGREGILIRNMCPIDRAPDDGMERDTILWVGRFRPVKRPEWVVELASRIPDRRFEMIGGFNEADRPLWQRVVDGADGLGNLRLAGQVSAGETESYYRRAMMLVLTSEAEGFPNVFLEACRAGIPTVTTFDPDGLIAARGLGYHCGDIEELIARVRELAEDEQTRREMGRRAFEYVRDNHSTEAVAARLIETFGRLAADRSRVSSGRK